MFEELVVAEFVGEDVGEEARLEVAEGLGICTHS